ncbi:hypothetical protein D3C85_1387030 [compost metagenome]
MNPERFELRGNRVHRVAGSDAVEIDFDRSVLAQLITVDAQVTMTDSLARLGDRLGRRDFFFSSLRAETPKIEQRLHRQIVGTVALH